MNIQEKFRQACLSAARMAPILAEILKRGLSTEMLPGIERTIANLCLLYGTSAEFNLKIIFPSTTNDTRVFLEGMRRASKTEREQEGWSEIISLANQLSDYSATLPRIGN